MENLSELIRAEVEAILQNYQGHGFESIPRRQEIEARILRTLAIESDTREDALVPVRQKRSYQARQRYIGPSITRSRKVDDDQEGGALYE